MKSVDKLKLQCRVKNLTSSPIVKKTLWIEHKIQTEGNNQAEENDKIMKSFNNSRKEVMSFKKIVLFDKQKSKSSFL